MAKHAEEFAQGQARILSNTTYLLAANVIQKLISLGYFVYYVRILGPSGTGLFEPVRSVIPITLTVIDLSLASVLTREIARTPHRAKEFMNNVLSVKVLVALVAFLTALAVNAFYDFNQLTRTLLFLASIVICLDMFTTTFTAVLRGMQTFRYEAIGVVLTSLTTVATGVVAFRLNAGVPGLMIAFIGGSIVNILFMGSVIRRKLGSFPRLWWNSALIRHFLLISMPILGAALLAKLFTYSDRYILLKISGKTAAGLYVAANKIPFALEFIAASFAASLLPAMSHFFITAKDQLSRIFEQATRYLIILSVPIAVGVFVLAHPFAVKLFGRSFADATTPLRIMISALPFIFLNFPVGSFLIAVNKQIWNTINLATAVTLSVILNLVLQPPLGVTGAAIAIFVSYIVLYSMGLYQVRRIIPINTNRLLLTAARTLLCAGIMAVPLMLLQKTFSPYFLLIPGGMLYLAAIFMFGELNAGDLRLILRAVGRKGT